jgi:hypothetical protein
MGSGEKLMRARDYFSYAIPSAFVQLLQIPRFRFSVTLFNPGGRRVVSERAAPLGGRIETRRWEVPMEQYGR